MRKAILSLLGTVLILSNMTMGAKAAHPVPDLTAGGSIHVTLKAGKETPEGGTLRFYRVGEIREEEGNYSFQLTGPFAGAKVSLENPQSPELAADLSAYAQTNKIPGADVKLEDGKAVYTVPGGQLGLYLVSQPQACQGYEALSAFVISVPNLEGDSYRYQVEASPKMGELQKEETIPPTTAPDTPTTPAEPGPKLPQTGQLNWPVPVLTVLGLILFTAGWILRRRGKYSEDEK